jgi:hypothetical protein
MTAKRAERDAVARLRAAMLDLTAAQRFTEANDVLEIIERIEPPARVAGVRAPGALLPAARAGRSESAMSPPSSSAPATYSGKIDGYSTCQNCGVGLSMHCTTHLLPCCPGSLMHGQDEGTWTPSAESSL